jgi:outer membrane lipoprotein-sorting protein
MNHAVGTSRRTLAGHFAGALAVLAVVAACGDGEPRTSSIGGSDLVRVRYTVTFSAEGEQQRQEMEVIADRDRRARLTITASPDETAVGTVTVWDGTAVLTYDKFSDPPYNRIENPEQEQFGEVPVFVYQPGSDRFAQACADARRVVTETLIGHAAVWYACAPSEAGGEGPREAHEMSLDQATGLVLKDTGDGVTLLATKVDFNPAIAADTFSTKVPEGVENAAQPKLANFRLPQVGGGELALDTYLGQPLVIVAGDPEGIRLMVQRLLPLTGGGTKPRLLGMLIAIPPEDWQGSLLDPEDAKSFSDSVSKSAGTFKVPVAIDPKGAAGYQITGPAGIEAGQTRPTAVGFIRSDGTIAHATTDKVTDDELRNQIDDLD